MDSVEVLQEIPDDMFGRDMGGDDLSYDDDADSYVDLSEDISAMYQRALVHHDANVAKKLFEKVLKVDTENADALYQLGLLYENDFGDTKTAKKMYEKAIGIESD